MIPKLKKIGQILTITAALCAYAVITGGCGGSSSNPITPPLSTTLTQNEIVDKVKVRDIPKDYDPVIAKDEMCNYEKNDISSGIYNQIPLHSTRAIIDTIDSLIVNANGIYKSQVDSDLDIYMINFDESGKPFPQTAIFDSRTNDILFYYNLTKRDYILTISHEFGHSIDKTLASVTNEFISTLIQIAVPLHIEKENPDLTCSDTNKSKVHASLDNIGTIINSQQHKKGVLSTLMVYEEFNGDYSSAIRAIANQQTFQDYMDRSTKMVSDWQNGQISDNDIANLMCSSFKKILKNNLPNERAEKIYNWQSAFFNSTLYSCSDVLPFE